MAKNGAKKKTGKKTGKLVPQPHGGAILDGVAPNHVPGPGRPPSRIREELRGSFSERIPILERIADDEEYSASDRARALDIMAKYGLGQAKIDESLVRELANAVGEVLGDVEGGPDLMREIHERWKPIVASRL